MADWTFERDYQFDPKSRQRVRVSATVTARGDRFYPRNYQFRLGQYYEVFVESGDLRVRRSHHATPPFAWTTVVTSSGTVSYPALYMHPRGHAILLYEDGSDTYLSVSYDEALSWSTPAVAIANGTKPNGACNPFDASEIIAAFIVASGKISAQSREAGELSFGTAFFFQDDAAADLLFEDDTFGLYWGYVTHNPLMGVFHIQGETDISTWRSYDLGRTWSREP